MKVDVIAILKKIYHRVAKVTTILKILFLKKALTLKVLSQVHVYIACKRILMPPFEKL